MGFLTDFLIPCIEQVVENTQKSMDASYGRTERYKVSWVSSDAARLDTKKLKSEMPEVYDRFCHTTSSRRFLINKVA